ncbi:MAG TPA: hypothetical protein VNM90_17145 [Haliangium sp.]|nr:hypothetical protein [Haliangium sp.]
MALALPTGRAHAQQKSPPPAQPGATQKPAAEPPDAAQKPRLKQQRAQPDRNQTLLDKADVITDQVSVLRGLARKRPIQRGVMQKHEIEQRLLSRIDEEYTPEELAAEELAMKRLGLIPAAIDYKKLVIDLLTDQIAGFYDPIAGELYIAGWQDMGMGETGDDMVMSHEITHALQDQHFDLRAFMKPDKQNGDGSVARQALVEGDGTALMMEHTLAKLKQPPPWDQPGILDMMTPLMSGGTAEGKLAEAPLVLRESLIFPYLAGLTFVIHFRKSHPWTRVDEIYRKPPLSTEHILHPEKYDAYEKPVRVTPVALPSLPGHRLAYHDVSGELGLSLFLLQHIVPEAKRTKPPKALRKKTSQAGAGWGGDRLAIYTPPDHDGSLRGVVGVVYSVWDEPADAVEYFDVLSDAMPGIAGGAPAVRTGDDEVAHADAAGAMYLAQRKDNAVVLIIGASRERADAVLADVWKRWRVQRK